MNKRRQKKFYKTLALLARIIKKLFILKKYGGIIDQEKLNEFILINSAFPKIGNSYIRFDKKDWLKTIINSLKLEEFYTSPECDDKKPRLWIYQIGAMI